MVDKSNVKEVEQNLKIKNKMGMHARPASLLVQTCNNFLADITFEKDGLEVNGKSILGLMTLAAPYGSDVKVRIKGPDADNALNAIENVFETKFNEE